MIASLIRWMTGAQARWLGVDPIDSNGLIPQRIYFANHQSNLDAPVFRSALPSALRRHTRPVAARVYEEGNVFRRFMSRRVFHAGLIERQQVTRQYN